MNAKTKYTPGPWTASRDNWSLIEAETNVQNSDGIPLTAIVADILAGENGLPVSENRANARLIAAAPELLIICQMMNELLKQVSIIAYTQEVQQYLPYGLSDKLKSFLRQCDVDRVIDKADGKYQVRQPAPDAHLESQYDERTELGE